MSRYHQWVAIKQQGREKAVYRWKQCNLNKHHTVHYQVGVKWKLISAVTNFESQAQLCKGGTTLFNG